MNIKRSILTRVVLVRFDEMPLGKLLSRSNAEQLRELFGFNSIDMIQENVARRSLVLQDGICRGEDSEQTIHRLAIEERRLVFSIDGTSKDADALYADLAEFLAGVSGETPEGYLEPLVVSDESEIVAQLEFPVESLLSPTYLEFAQSAVADATSSQLAEAIVKPAHLGFVVEYVVGDNTLSDYRISFSRKDFTVEPRPGYPLSEQMYYSKAPVDTETHVALLGKLEERILQRTG